MGNYQGEKIALFDEFEKDDFDSNNLKMLLDRNPQEVTTSMGGKTALFEANLVVLLSNHKPKDMQWVKLDTWKYRITDAFFAWSKPSKLYMEEVNCNF